jgi:hypothetical protein
MRKPAPYCESSIVRSNCAACPGFVALTEQMKWCLQRLRRNMFKRSRFPVEIILVCVRWYCKYGITYRDLSAMMQDATITAQRLTEGRSPQALLTVASVPVDAGELAGIQNERPNCVANVTGFVAGPPGGRLNLMGTSTSTNTFLKKPVWS